MLALCENIRRLRRAAGLSQEELAGRLGVSRQSVSLWEQGVTNPTVENIYAMAEVLGASFNELMAPPEEGTTPSRAEALTARSFDELMTSSEAGALTTPPAEPLTPSFFNTATVTDAPTPSFSNTATVTDAPTSSFSNTPTAADKPTPSFSNAPMPGTESSAPDSERAKRAEAQYYRYRHLVKGAWICAGILGGGFLLFVFSVVILGDFGTRYPDSVVNNVVGPALMLVSILMFLVGLVTLIVMSSKAGIHRRRMGDLFDLAIYEELKRGRGDYASKRK